jgi:hypothetical protein
MDPRRISPARGDPERGEEARRGARGADGHRLGRELEDPLQTADVPPHVGERAGVPPGIEVVGIREFVPPVRIRHPEVDEPLRLRVRKRLDEGGAGQ